MNRYIIGLFIASILGILTGAGSAYIGSFENVDISMPEKMSVDIYESRGGEGGIDYDSDKPIERLDKEEEIRLRVGNYVAVAKSSSGELVNSVIPFTVMKGREKVNINPSFSEETLARKLTTERTSAQQALTKKYSSITPNYIFSKDKLFLGANWYGVILKSKDPQVDDLRAILKKDEGKWVVETNPPQVIIGIPSNGHIPQEVIRGTNNL